MYDQELDTAAPYDNMEFPIRKPGTGTWPGPGSAGGGAGSGGGGGAKLFGHHTTSRMGASPKLAPLVEVEGSEGVENNHRMQTLSFGSTSSSSSTPPQSPQGQGQNSFSTQSSMTSYNRAMTSQNRTLTSQNQVTKKGPSTPTSPTPTLTSPSFPVTTSTTSISTTTTTTTAATTATTVSESDAKEKNSKPVIVTTNDSNLYMAAQVTSGSDKQRKKTQRQVETEEEDFKRQDLNPASRLALERVYTRHPDFYQLNSKVLDEGSLLKQDVLDIYRKSGETLTYEQLLQGMLVDGERFLLGSCWLYYTHVQFLDVEGTKTLREPYGRGRVGLTSKRALFLSTETYTDANLEPFHIGDKKKVEESSGYKLEVSKRSTVTFKNIPLSNFHSAEMEVVTGTAAQTKITRASGCCGCFGGKSKTRWVSTPPMTRSINTRVLRVGVSMPPWQTRMFVDIHLDPTMSLTVARDFISQLHAFAPHMH